MANYLLDTNVLIDFGRNPTVRHKLEKARESGSAFVIAPPALIELVRGVVKAGAARFSRDKQVFEWLHLRSEIEELPRPFMARILKSSAQNRSGVRPEHYMQLIQMIVEARDYAEFLKKAEAGGSVWKEVSRSDEIHEHQLDREFDSLQKLAKVGEMDIARNLAQSFGTPGCHPNPVIFLAAFSCAIEFLKSSLSKVRAGSKPWKNDRGLWVDLQLMFYLARSDLQLLTNEDFSEDIRQSPQKTRIVHPTTLP